MNYNFFNFIMIIIYIINYIFIFQLNKNILIQHHFHLYNLLMHKMMVIQVINLYYNLLVLYIINNHYSNNMVNLYLLYLNMFLYLLYLNILIQKNLMHFNINYLYIHISHLILLFINNLINLNQLLNMSLLIINLYQLINIQKY